MITITTREPRPLADIQNAADDAARRSFHALTGNPQAWGNYLAKHGTDGALVQGLKLARERALHFAVNAAAWNPDCRNVSDRAAHAAAAVMGAAWDLVAVKGTDQKRASAAAQDAYDEVKSRDTDGWANYVPERITPDQVEIWAVVAAAVAAHRSAMASGALMPMAAAKAARNAVAALITTEQRNIATVAIPAGLMRFMSHHGVMGYQLDFADAGRQWRLTGDRSELTHVGDYIRHMAKLRQDGLLTRGDLPYTPAQLNAFAARFPNVRLDG